MLSGLVPKQINDADVQKGNTAVLKYSGIVLRLPAISCAFLPKKICVGPRSLVVPEPPLMSACCVFEASVGFRLFFLSNPVPNAQHVALGGIRGMMWVLCHLLVAVCSAPGRCLAWRRHSHEARELIKKSPSSCPCPHLTGTEEIKAPAETTKLMGQRGI